MNDDLIIQSLMLLDTLSSHEYVFIKEDQYETLVIISNKKHDTQYSKFERDQAIEDLRRKRQLGILLKPKGSKGYTEDLRMLKKDFKTLGTKKTIIKRFRIFLRTVKSKTFFAGEPAETEISGPGAGHKNNFKSYIQDVLLKDNIDCEETWLLASYLRNDAKNVRILFGFILDPFHTGLTPTFKTTYGDYALKIENLTSYKFSRQIGKVFVSENTVDPNKRLEEMLKLTSGPQDNPVYRENWDIDLHYLRGFYT